MNKRQLRESKACEELKEEGFDKDCMVCSCNICIAQESTNMYKKENDLLEVLLDEKNYQINDLKLRHNRLYATVDEMFRDICNQWEPYLQDVGKNADIEQLVGDLRKLMYGDYCNE